MQEPRENSELKKYETCIHFLNAKFIRNWDHLGSNDHLSEMKDKDYAK